MFAIEKGRWHFLGPMLVVIASGPIAYIYHYDNFVSSGALAHSAGMVFGGAVLGFILFNIIWICLKALFFIISKTSKYLKIISKQILRQTYNNTTRH